MKGFVLPVMVASALVLSACASAAAAQPPATASNPPTRVVIPTVSPTIALQPVTAQPTADLTIFDQQGMVAVGVTPLNLKDGSDTLDFDVSMNTHSVDLSMDLSKLATLTTDAGIRVQAIAWDAPGSGHHVSGKLSFPATKDGKSILDGATKLTMTIINVDAPSRTFEWQLQ